MLTQPHGIWGERALSLAGAPVMNVILSEARDLLFSFLHNAQTQAG
jgi:hypothetical protein